MTNIRIEDHCWHIILNSNANEKKCERNWKPVAELLERRNIRYELHIVRNPGEGIATAKELCQSGIRHLVAAGGDGTINEVVNGIFISGVDSHEVYMAVLPLGRGNDWARTHHYPNTIAKVVECWRDGNFMQHDIGKVTSQTLNKSYIRHFINIAGFGFDADVIYDVTNNPTHLFGFNVYVLSLLKTLFSHKPTPIKVSADNGFHYEGKVFMVIAAICQYNGGGIREAKYAIPDDGKIDLIVVPAMSIPKVLKHLKDMTSGDHIDKIKEIRKVLATDITITPDQLFRAETEGELLVTGNYRVEVVPNALNVLTC
jgi:YegS/Rv2252/BmrU family lipid kinase